MAESMMAESVGIIYYWKNWSGKEQQGRGRLEHHNDRKGGAVHAAGGYEAFLDDFAVVRQTTRAEQLLDLGSAVG
jgi:hypothetical protein